ncbi:MAG: filamentous hemagglutinin N-terminal domain-containing protein, partial [Planctomycetota bacterium]
MKGSRGRPTSVRRAARNWIPGIAMLAVVLAGQLLAGPVGEEVVHGTAHFTREGNLTTIEASHNAIVHYQSFNVARPETVRFVQPSELARVLNRINGAAPSHINGTLRANGIVYFVNPAGVYFGPNSIVDVGGIHAAAGALSNADFLGGIDRFVDLNGSVVNWGRITADSVKLAGRHVANYGSIIAEKGMVAMGAGDEVYLGTVGGQMMVKVEGGGNEGDGPAVENVGSINAAKGSVMLGAGDMFSLAVRNSGTVKADEVAIQGGKDGVVDVQGTLDASNDAGQGGTVTVTGDRVAVSGATVDASGAEGGGTIRIGGDLRGEGDLPTAARTYVSADSVLAADALLTGGGGTVVVWSDELTGFYGAIRATGGPAGGDGGFAEVSSRGAVLYRGTANLSAPAGARGTLLMDPLTVTILGGTGDGAADGTDTFQGDVNGIAGSILFDPLEDTAPSVVYE